MNSRQRVLAALNHREPDRVPIDLGSAESTGIAARTYRELCEYLQLRDTHRILVSDVFQMLAEIGQDVIERLHIDVLNVPTLGLSWGAVRGEWRSWELFDGTRVLIPADLDLAGTEDGGFVIRQEGLAVARMPRGGYYFDTIENVPGLEATGRGRHALGGVLPDTDKARYPLMTDAELEFAHKWAVHLFEETDKALMGNVHLNITEVGSFEDWFILLVTEPHYLAEYYGKQAESIIANLELYHEAVGDRLTAMYFGQDFGTQMGEMISPRTFREVMAPHYKTIFDWVHRHTQWKVFFHSCGSIYNIIPDLMEIGVDILNPIQTGAARMEPEQLKREFGDRLIFWGGGVDVQQLPFIRVDEVVEQVRERIDCFAPGGGYVFAPTHNIQANTPAANVIAAYDAVYQYGKYPISGIERDQGGRTGAIDLSGSDASPSAMWPITSHPSC